MTDNFPSEPDEPAPVLTDLEETELAQEESAAEFEATTLEGCRPDSEDVARLFRYVRLHNRYGAEIERLNKQHKAMVRSLENKRRSLEFVHSAPCADITRRLLHSAGNKSKSHKTPFGTVGFRASKPTLEIVDPIKFIEEAEKAGNTELVRIKKEPNKAALNEQFKQSGEEFPGTELRDGFEKFYVS